MIREEHIYEASKAYSEYEYNQTDYENGFIKGAEWADNHPKNVWHDASEIPRMNHKNIFYQTNYCSLFNMHIAFVPTCLRSGKITSYSWNEFVKDVNMRRWAYTDDLLPKGGEK